MLSSERIIKTWKDGVAIIDKDFVFSQYNSTFQTLFYNLSGFDIKGNISLIQIQKTSTQAYTILSYWLSKAKSSGEFSTKNLHSDNQYLYISCIYYPIEEAYLIYLRDATKATLKAEKYEGILLKIKEKNKLLERQEIKTKAILANMPIGLMQITLTEQGKIMNVNDQFTSLTKYTTETIRKVSRITDLVHEKDKQRVEFYIDARLKGNTKEEQIKCRIITYLGEVLHVELCVSYTDLEQYNVLPINERKLILAYLTDITELQNERDLLKKRNNALLKFGASAVLLLLSLFGGLSTTYERLVVNDVVHTYNETLHIQESLTKRNTRLVKLYEVLIQDVDKNKEILDLLHTILEEDSLKEINHLKEPDNYMYDLQKKYLPKDFTRPEIILEKIE